MLNINYRFYNDKVKELYNFIRKKKVVPPVTLLRIK